MGRIGAKLFMLIANQLSLANSDVFGQGILESVREKSVKSQGILVSIVCGNPVNNHISVISLHIFEFSSKSNGSITYCTVIFIERLSVFMNISKKPRYPF